MRNIFTQFALHCVKETRLRLLLISLLLFPFGLLAQITHPLNADMLQFRQQKSFNKASVLQKKPINLSNLPALLSVQQADSISNPLLQIIQSLVGPGVTVSNIQTTLPKTSDIYGSFSGGTNVVGMDHGLIMTSGSVFNALGPNISPSTSQNNGLPGYLAIDTAGFDAAVISFDVVSNTSFLSFKYVFASEEYNEYVGSQFNDDFAFLISGPGIPAGTNIAMIPGTNTPVDINNVNLASNPQYYINNDSSQNADPVRFANLEYDGLTTVLVTSAITVVPGATYTITLVIQDVSDAIYDSGVFIEGGSITSDSCVLSLFAEKKDITCNGANNGSIDLTYNGANGAVQFAWTNGATTEDIHDLSPGSYNVTVTDAKGCKKSLANPVVINEPSVLVLGDVKITAASCSGGSGGSAEVSVSGGTPPYQYILDTATNNTGIFTGLPAGTYNYTVADSNNCSTSGSFVIPQGSEITCLISVIPNPTVKGQAKTTIFLGYGPQSVILRGNATSGTGPYKYDWGTNGKGRFILVKPATTTTYNLTVTDKNGCQSTCSVTINVVDVRCGKDLQKVMVCHKVDNHTWHQLCISASDVDDHLKHGDYLGACSSSSIITSFDANANSETVSLNFKAVPNPTSAYFTLQIAGNATDKIKLRILDLNGREIEVRNNLNSGQIIQLGSNYRSGIYIAELTQGRERKTLKLVKY
jgi:SprB repeat/Secretion system C-terminal sorting domain